MLKGKREREASFDASGDKDSQAQPLRKKMNELQREGSSGAGSLATMLNLPQEILSTIFELACFSRPSTSSPTASLLSSPRSYYDHETTLNLLTSARCLYAQVIPIAFRQVKVTRPSDLALLHQALLTRPMLAKLITRFDLGPESELPSRWWPLQVRGDLDYDGSYRGWIANGLLEQESDRLPQWCSRGQRNRPVDFNLCCAGHRYFEALMQASVDIDVNIFQWPMAWKGGDITSDSYVTKVFQLQAAMDLYLCHMRRIEDAIVAGGHPFDLNGRMFPQAGDACHTRTCSHYPRMTIKMERVSTDKGPPARKDCLVVLFEEVQSHLARRGSPVDRFDHPLLFARSQLERYHVNHDKRPILDQEGPYLLPQGGRETASLDPMSFGGVVGLTRAVLSLLPDTCRVEIRPKVLEESVRLGWERKTEEAEVEAE